MGDARRFEGPLREVVRVRETLGSCYSRSEDGRDESANLTQTREFETSELS